MNETNGERLDRLTEMLEHSDTMRALNRAELHWYASAVRMLATADPETCDDWHHAPADRLSDPDAPLIATDAATRSNLRVFNSDGARVLTVAVWRTDGKLANLFDLPPEWHLHRV